MKPINRKTLVSFICGEVTQEQHKQILSKIQNNDIIRQWYLQVKREYDVYRYLDQEMSVHEKIEFEEILIENSNLRKYFNLVSDIHMFLKIEAFKERLKKELK